MTDRIDHRAAGIPHPKPERREREARRLGRQTQIRARNPERAAESHAEAFGPQADACRALNCCVCGASAPSEPHHEPPRSVGGKDEDAVPLCRACHQRRHTVGFYSFWSAAGIDPETAKDGVRAWMGTGAARYATPVDRKRLGRAVHLQAQPLAPGVYRVTGGAEPHRVDVTDRAHPHCNCRDHAERNVPCKHILAALIVAGDPVVVSAAKRLITAHAGEPFRVCRAREMDPSDPWPNAFIVARGPLYVCTVHGAGLFRDDTDGAAAAHFIARLLNEDPPLTDNVSRGYVCEGPCGRELDPSEITVRLRDDSVYCIACAPITGEG
jgi:SWIM zinc finger